MPTNLNTAICQKTERFIYKFILIKYKFIPKRHIKMATTKLIEKVGHSPTLNTVLMVEETLKSAGQVITLAELKKILPKKIMHQTLITILDYLQISGKIIIGTKGILWIYAEKKELDELIKKGTEI